MKRSLMMGAALTAVMMLATACGGASQTQPAPSASNPAQSNSPAPAPAAKLTGEIKVDGSSTVGPISIAVAEEFMKAHKDVKVSVGISGTSGGFKKWVKGETDINDSSRKIKDSEVQEAKKLGIEALELPVAYDGITVVVSKENDFVQCITTAELKKIWDKDSTVKTWKDVNPAWPAEEIKLYGPGTDSGTFEYFTEHINGKALQSRSDYTASEDDNTLVKGVTGSKYAMGYFGYAYFVENATKLKALQIDAGKGCTAPNDETISGLTYPIARLIYIHPSTKALERPEVKEFVNFYLKNAATLSKEVGYTPLSAKQYEEALAKVK
ncbi:MAG TPA: PstS family phosphate ABC transporter substrate-binding protein [Symbiobacteriaceae bacterium]|nr:PstS family phosphate ABC transporter substrate-binding protein [Symbiobacteriaceae bacterium]